MTQNIPKLRFPEFSGEWEAKKLGDLAQTVSGLTYSPKDIREEGVLVLRSSNIKKGRLAFDDSVFVKKSIRYNQLNKGDLLICVRNGSQALIGKNVYIDIELKNTTHGAFMTVIRSDESKFISQLFQTDQYYGQVSADLGARINSINNSQLLKYKFYFPGKNEQEKITRFLTVVDERVTTIDKKVELLQRYKKGVMQKIFTQKLRFKDETGANYVDWQEKKMSSVLLERNEQSPKSTDYPLMAFIAHVGVAPKGERYDREFLISNGSDKKYKKTEYGDFIYSSNNLETGSIGLNRYGPACISPVYSIFQVADSCDARFMGNYLLRNHFINQMKRYRQGVVYGQWKIRESDFLNIKEKIPTSYEQRKIADFLTSLDDKITLEKAKLEQAKLFKKSLLQRMFV